MEKIPVLRSSKRRSSHASPDESASSTLRNSVSSGSSSTADHTPIGRTFLQSPPSSSTPAIARDSLAQLRRSHRQIEMVPAEGISDRKGPAIYHLEISPSCSIIASQHTSHNIKIWSITTGAVECIIKYSSKVQAGPRSRMYFLRPLAIISEASTLVAITTSFGNTIEIWNWAKKKRVQSIDHAARWACVRGDAFEANMRPLAVYRSETDRIDLFSAVRDAKKPFVESRRIDLKNADLPFVPKFPDLAFSATGPLLVGAAGPRPGAPPEMQQTILLAWQIDDSQDSPRPYRWVVPDHPELSGALPASLASYGSVAISIWHPANYKYIVTAMGEDKKVPISVNVRHVLVWDLATNRTRIFQIPNVQSCISPDCRYVAFCDIENGRFVVLDIASGYEIWSGPDEIDIQQAGGPGVATSEQLLSGLNKVTEFRFTDDSGLLFVADSDGAIGIYEVRQRPGSGAGGSSTSGTSRNSSARSGNGGIYDFGERRNAVRQRNTTEYHQT